MIVLVLNCGSSSVKFRVIDAQADGPSTGRARYLARGSIDGIGASAKLRFECAGAPALAEAARVPDHATAVGRALEWLSAARVLRRVAAVGHRIVHGGEDFTGSTRIDEAVAARIETLGGLAPLHNLPSLAGIRACRQMLAPATPMVAVFDTTFHATLPERAYRYALPHELSLRHGIRRHGFHGTSFRSILACYGRLTGAAPEQIKLVALHLGNGCSAVAIEGGRSVDTSMGFTPLEGLMMGTRSGDLDPALIAYLAEREGVSAEEVGRWLNERSGLLGVSGVSHDMRALLAREGEDERARLAVDMFCYRARKFVGAYLAALGGADALVFSGGIGENSPEVRKRIAEGLAWLGLELDEERNREAIGREACIGVAGARLPAWVIPSDEEAIIAHDTLTCLCNGGGA